MPPGQVLRFGARGVQAHAFWKLPVHNKLRYEDERQYDEQLRELFRESVRTRLRTHRPVLSELSGGLDSSSVECMASNLVANRQAEAPEVVSVSFGQPGAPDEKFYRTVQSFCSVKSVYRTPTFSVPKLGLSRRCFTDSVGCALHPFGAVRRSNRCAGLLHGSGWRFGDGQFC